MSHRLRSTVSALEAGAVLPPLSAREECRRSPVQDVLPENEERRSSAQRGALRHRGTAQRASVSWRGKNSLVEVVNVSKGGVTIESRIAPDIGESVEVALHGGDAVAATVRWRRAGRIGLQLA